MTGQSHKNNKRILKNTILLYSRMLISMAIGFYTSRIVLDTLGVTDFGIYNVVGGIVGMLATLYGPMASATQRWITFALGKEDKAFLKKVFQVSLSSQLVIATLLFIVIETIGLWYFYTYAIIPENRMKIAFWVFQISTATMFLTIINVPFQGAIIAHEKMGVFAGFTISDVSMKLIICYTLYYSSTDKLLLYAILLFITYLITFIGIQLYCHLKIEEAKFHLGWDRRIFKDIWRLAFWSISGNLAFIGYSQGITLLINMFYGPAMNTAAGIGSQATNIINQFSSNFQTALNPQITKCYAANELSNMHNLIFQSTKFSYFLMLFLAVPFFYEAHFLLTIWLKEVPDYTITFMRLSIFICILTALRNPLYFAAMATGNIKRFQLITNGILLLICPVSYILYKQGTIPETATIVYIFFLTITIIISAYLLRSMVMLNFQSFLKNVLYKIIIVSMIAFGIPYPIHCLMEEGWRRLLLLSLLSLLSSSFTIFIIGINKQERIFILNIIKSKINSLKL